MPSNSVLPDQRGSRRNDRSSRDGTRAINGFRDLRVWQVGMELVERVYRLTSSLPKHEEYGLASQMRRAVVSVPSNIAEGHARWHGREYLHHLAIAQASLAELDTQLEIAARLTYISSEDASSILGDVASLGRQIHALRRALAKAMRQPSGAESSDASQEPLG